MHLTQDASPEIISVELSQELLDEELASPIVRTVRDEFNQITRVSGVDGLIKRLKEKNA